MDEQELNKKLAEWAGWTHIPYRIHPAEQYKINDDCWLEPGYDTFTLEHWCFNPPEFSRSLDACFKWLVPKLNKLCDIMLSWSKGNKQRAFHVSKNKYTATVWLVDKTVEGSGEHPALALCLAIEKLIDKELDNVSATPE